MQGVTLRSDRFTLTGTRPAFLIALYRHFMRRFIGDPGLYRRCCRTSNLQHIPAYSYEVWCGNHGTSRAYYPSSM